jgi:hypothetical protein
VSVSATPPLPPHVGRGLGRSQRSPMLSISVKSAPPRRSLPPGGGRRQAACHLAPGTVWARRRACGA